MSDEAGGKAKKGKGGKGKKMILLGALVVGVGGAGAAGGLFAAGAFNHAPGPKEDFNKPQLVLAGENPEEIGNALAVKAKEAEGEAGGHEPGHGKGIDLPAPSNPSKYQATYFQVQAPFTTNMSDTDAFAQLSIAVATYYDNRVIQAMTTHEMAIRSAILMLLAQETDADLSTPKGKEALQAKLKTVINDILKQKTGYGGIDNVYFTNFVIQ
ncbi:MAG: flagellar basal body-associated protein FliL [Sphingobium sp.]|nr:MAG: flagellar basal body-associated protein FliL [Sphingobium sp.]